MSSVPKKDMKEMIMQYEQQNSRRVSEDPWRCGFHLMPVVGWLNDPNGLCHFKGEYHIFFQYAPMFPSDSLKAWGHYSGKDLLHLQYEGAAILPDTAYDQDGAYSGTALVEDGKMYLFYTGNVKRDGDYDYILSGRESNTMLISSEDGINFSEKKCILDNGDYPPDYSCHIRDPKVWRENGRHYLALGGRTKKDKGTVLLYQSVNPGDFEYWELVNEITTEDIFGYMWECPDFFRLNGKMVLSVCPQGLEAEETRFQNIYQSGWFLPEGDIGGEYRLGTFTEWDMGFDFYAPQTFVDDKGRTILIGWAGVPDAGFEEPTVERGWVHLLTVPRELTEEGGRIYQYPVAELEQLRGEKRNIPEGVWTANPGGRFDWIIQNIHKSDFEVRLSEELKIAYSGGCVTMEFTGDMGAGRTVRRAECHNLTQMRILADSSILEVYINGGELVMTTRIFPKDMDYKIKIVVNCLVPCLVPDTINNSLWYLTP